MDIGYRYATPSRKDVLKDRLAVRRQLKSSLEMEKAARARTSMLPYYLHLTSYLIMPMPIQFRHLLAI